MIICALTVYRYIIEEIHSVTISFFIAMLFGGMIYVILIIMLKILSKEEFLMLPYGEKIFKMFKKVRLH